MEEDEDLIVLHQGREYCGTWRLRRAASHLCGISLLLGGEYGKARQWVGMTDRNRRGEHAGVKANAVGVVSNRMLKAVSNHHSSSRDDHEGEVGDRESVGDTYHRVDAVGGMDWGVLAAYVADLGNGELEEARHDTYHVRSQDHLVHTSHNVVHGDRHTLQTHMLARTSRHHAAAARISRHGTRTRYTWGSLTCDGRMHAHGRRATVHKRPVEDTLHARGVGRTRPEFSGVPLAPA